MKFTLLIPATIFAICAAQAALADATVCNLEKVVKDQNGSETVTSCTLTIDSNDQSGNPGSGGIAHKNSIGTLNSDCDGYPGDYDFSTGKLKPFRMWDQGEQSASDTQSLFEMINEMNYLKHGDLGFTQDQVASVHWVAGGFGASLTNLYVAYDSSGKKLGIVFLGGMSPYLSFQGCYVK